MIRPRCGWVCACGPSCGCVRARVSGYVRVVGPLRVCTCALGGVCVRGLREDQRTIPSSLVWGRRGPGGRSRVDVSARVKGLLLWFRRPVPTRGGGPRSRPRGPDHNHSRLVKVEGRPVSDPTPIDR